MINAKEFFKEQENNILKVKEIIKDEKGILVDFTKVKEVHTQDLIQKIKKIKKNYELRMKETDNTYIIEIGDFPKEADKRYFVEHIMIIAK